MGSLYDPDDIAIGTTLLSLNYAYGESSSSHEHILFSELNTKNIEVSIATIWVYDYIITLADEITFISNSKWRKVKMLYILCRYLPFLLIGLNTYQVLQPEVELDMCQTYDELNSWLEGVILVSSECMFILRTYAIWERNRRILTVLLCSFFAILIPVVYVMINYDSSTVVTSPPVPNISSCYNAGQSHVIVVAYILLVVAELEILLFTLYRAIRHFRHPRGGSHLMNILIQHNIFYFSCGLIFSLLVILTIALLPDPYGDMTSNLQVAIHALLVTRMHLELWKSDRAQIDIDFTDIALSRLDTVDPAPLVLPSL
ncbi:hypothetical protein BV22DRAFT_1055566 [Leucogyrophana mollusca]|uniref:Uncharacterized protein n=1 Tax=Leucogyrophana mollusca TaxID=85980 RepID=A0ACB8BXE7_9AGAM|nr:hypothetical protein BV22DRAFT_1055566 [Leucogyrophana mollusca]